MFDGLVGFVFVEMKKRQLPPTHAEVGNVHNRGCAQKLQFYDA